MNEATPILDIDKIVKKDKLTDKEKSCLVYGYARGLAQSVKEQGLFKDWKIEEIISEYLKGISS